jgi:hypothetical protein
MSDLGEFYFFDQTIGHPVGFDAIYSHADLSFPASRRQHLLTQMLGFERPSTDLDKPGKTPCVSPTLPTGRRLPTSFTAPRNKIG